MKTGLIACALALGIGALPIAAIADDPNDPEMRSAAARARDKAEIRRLNQQELARVRARDAGYAKYWQAYRDAGDGRSAHTEQRADYERRMAEWRRAVAACNSGHLEYCAR